MTAKDIEYFRDALRIKRAELTPKSRTRENIAIERSADALDEVAFKSSRELAIAQLDRESTIQRDIKLALHRLDGYGFGQCVHCGGEITRRRLEAVPWAPLCIRCQESADHGDEIVLASIEPVFLDAA
jgi:DnaK suppressor protein